MGFLNRVAAFFRAPDATFAAETPRPIDQLILEMSGRGDTPRIGRAQALSVPAVLRGRNMICSISTLPLVQYDKTNTPVRNALFEQIDPNVPNVVTLARTVEDLLFEATAWWRITSFAWDGFPANAARVDPLRVTLDDDGTVWIDGKRVPASELIRFYSPNPGLLSSAGRPIRRALLLDQAAAMYADEPRPLDYFTPADGADPADDEAIQDVLRKWKAARKERGTAYVPAALKYNAVDQPTPADLQLVELQRQAILDIANALGLDPEDLGMSTTSRTYQNATDRRQDRINDTLSPYMRAITDRLSMGDVTKRGHLVRFDLDDYMKADPRTRWDVYEKANALGVMNSETIAAEEKIPALPPPPTPAPAPAASPTGEPAPTAVTAGANWPHLTLALEAGITFDGIPTSTFSVDEGARTVTGLAVPYGQVAVSRGRRWRFLPGSLTYADLGRVKLLRDHDNAQALGRAIELTDTDRGVVVTFKVARGPEGDRALALAADGVLDGLSIGVDFGPDDTTPDPDNPSVLLVHRAVLREVSLTAMPAFDDSRLTSVAASRDGGSNMPCATCGQVHAEGVVCTASTAPPATTPAPTPATFTAEQVAQMFAAIQVPVPPQPEQRQVVDPAPAGSATFVNEPTPYRFDRGGNFIPGDVDFSTDLRDMAFANDREGTETDAGRRVMGLLRETFAVTPSGNVTDLNPTIQRPDLFVDQRDFRTPLWDMVSKGAPPNGVNPFRFPKFSSTTPANLVADHVEGTEPTSGTYNATGQTVNPTALSGKASITREVWDMGGNPAVSTLVFNQMVRGYREGLESAVATFLNTLTAATDITLNTGATAGAAPTSAQLSGNWESALAGLQFVRGYDFSAFAIEQNLYNAFVAATDGSGRKLYPILNPQNANGTSASRFRTLDLAGVVGVPSWALTATAGSPNNSWLFDPSTVHGWATAPQRLEFPGTNAAGAYAPVAMVDLAIWGYKAFANSDIAGVRQVTYDTTT